MGRYLGQHFLVSRAKLARVIEALELRDGDTIVEIGPGHGELTQEIRNEKLEIRIIAIEKDKQLAEFLQRKYGNDKNIQVIQGDVLKILPNLTYQLTNLKTYKLIGNVPYYITGHLFRIIGELKNKPSLVVFTIQKEVAERIVAKPPKMNLLAASVQFWAEPKIIGYIPKGDFRPQPKVDSAIIKLETRDEKLEMRDGYYKLVKALFKQPRKTILNNLRPTTDNLQLITKKLEAVSIKPDDRPERLKIEQIIQLSTLF